jgi:hypothetical protein
LFRSLGPGVDEGGDEGSAESALAEQPAEQIGQLQGNKEGVSYRPRAQYRRNENVAAKAKQPARQRPTSDQTGRAPDAARLGWGWPVQAGTFSMSA